MSTTTVKICWPVICAIVIALAGFAFAEEAGTYEGKPVEYWIDQLKTGSTSQRVYTRTGQAGPAPTPARRE